MRLIPLLAVFLLLVITPVLAQEVFYFPQVGDGFGLRTTLIFVNTGVDSTLTVDFFDSNGQPLEFDLPPFERAVSFQIELPSGEAFSSQSSGTGAPLTGDLLFGYVKITSTGPDVGGTAVFTFTDPTTGQIVYDAGVPASQTLTEFSLFVDSMGNRRTGLATVNAGDGPANVTMGLRDRSLSFAEIATTDKQLNPGEHLPKFVDELIDDPILAEQVGEMEGVLTVQSDQPLAAVVLRQNETALTAFPVVPVFGVSESGTHGDMGLRES